MTKEWTVEWSVDVTVSLTKTIKVTKIEVIDAESRERAAEIAEEDADIIISDIEISDIDEDDYDIEVDLSTFNIEGEVKAF